ncbi:hypothetical protein BXO88_12215 [Oribacterium sp. C9]|uniref:GNAT family N-acetyltransferase n=1 Tax=Oribacterium sp. C9 TaxID=1943579 RepID=UPI0009CCF90B|nr:GNAT family N-acetyltransferase [Oribacterium sp. C9]OON85419.1 hypothetical protein BXO88_12215 [Oribacterium sp. C9]
MNELYVLNEINQKCETKALYEEVFPEDKGPFSDWYYEDRCRDNIIVCLKKDGEVAAMAHLNPFTVCNRNGQSAEIYYIYAVATRKEERNKGYMTEVLNKSFEIMKDKGIPFCYLIPVDESIYTPFGFHTVSKFTIKRILDFTLVTSNYDIYLREDENYIRRALIEDELCENMEEALPKDPVIMVKLISPDSFSKFSGLAADTEESEKIEWLKNQRIYISESV